MRSLLSRLFFIFPGIISLLLLLGVSYAVAPRVSTHKPKVDIHVGIYAPFSNEHAFIGRSMLGAMEMARDQLESSTINYTFYTLDQLPDSPNAANTLQKFIDAHQITVVLTEGSAGGLLVAPIAKRNNIIHFSMANNPKIADGKNNFLAISPGYEEAVDLVNQVRKDQVQQLEVNTTKHPSDARITQHVVKQLQENSPIVQVFHLLHQSAVLAMKTNSNYSSQYIVEQIHVIASEDAGPGALSFDENGILHAYVRDSKSIKTLG